MEIKQIINQIWQNKTIRVQIWNIISAAAALAIVYLTNLQNVVGDSFLVEIIILGTVITQQLLKWLNKQYFGDIGVTPDPEISVVSNFGIIDEPLDTGEPEHPVPQITAEAVQTAKRYHYHNPHFHKMTQHNLPPSTNTE
ncbi:MAG: hypothetical protein LBG59_08940 [Candidatus Peribacteria bacterium]|jgi:hypothetical protein|nr:hypothetical protein [Candidatus Peribacteria bacterium]